MKTNESTADAKVCRRRKDVLVDLRVNAEFPDLFRYSYRRLTLEEKAKELENAAREFHAFIRDHRSQDRVALDVERVLQDQCEACGEAWETMEDAGKTICASCGREVQP